jgi:outer membrane receptor for ferrienterochelin and colicin
MRKVISNRLIFIFCFTLFITGCSKDGDGVAPCSTAWATDLQGELNALVNAGAAYGADPSAANCSAYKSAYQNYIDALKPYGNCATLTGQDRTDWQQALNEAEAEVATLCQ